MVTALTVAISDNGWNMGTERNSKPPRSLSARMTGLGGSLAISRTAPGLGLQITLPRAGVSGC